MDETERPFQFGLRDMLTLTAVGAFLAWIGMEYQQIGGLRYAIITLLYVVGVSAGVSALFVGILKAVGFFRR